MFTDEEILNIGFSLEEAGLTHSEIDSCLEHAGVRGMKWGVRKGKSKTGMTRRSGAVIDRNLRTINRIERARSGNGLRYKAAAKVGRLYVKKEMQQENWKYSLNQLKSQNARIKSGKETSLELIAKNNVPLSSLLISRRPRPR
jgi:hypothetical protein